jgi:hypothetical protein
LYLLYIDPGTGSILFSLFIGLAAAIYFFARTLFIKAKYFISGRRSVVLSKKEAYVIYNEAAQYWNVFKPIVDEFEKRGIAVTYLTSAENDPFFNNTYQYINGMYIGEGNKAFTKLNLLSADICLMTTPGIEVYQLKRSKNVSHYAHILHDTGDTTCYRLFGIDWFDSILLSGEYQITDIRKLENLRGTREKILYVIGSTYLDVYNEKIKKITTNKISKFTVLISPSWGPGSLLNEFGEKLLDPLSSTGWKVIIRPHPQSRNSEKEILQRLEEKYKNNPEFEWDYSPENIATLSRADIMISDFSGIIFDFVFLFNKPVIYTNAFFNLEMYDASDLDHIPWRFEVVKTFGIELKKNDLENIVAIIKKAKDDKIFATARMDAKKIAWQYIGASGKRAVDYLVNKRQELIALEEPGKS